ncbi:MAG: SGNH/GDSL hydrolase family protein [Planctomycetes bacterium]|nr:SGNH/GDSL hydrolase family protein [Planctomycetota bacterium]
MPEAAQAVQEPPQSRSPLRRGFTISCVTLGALAALFEILPRCIEIPGLRSRELDPLAFQLQQARVGPHPYLAYSNKASYDLKSDKETIHHNALGFRGPETTWAKPAGTFRIFCIGGSSTYGIGPSSNETNWPERLQAHLNERGLGKKVEVINGGCQGYSSFEMAIQLATRGVSFQPDLVLTYETINDVRCALYPGVVPDNTHWRANWPVARKSELEGLLEHSLTFLAWRRYCTDWWENSKNLGSWVIVDFGKWTSTTGDDYAQPTDAELGFLNTRRNLVTILATARAHGAEVMFVTQGTRMSDFDRAAKSAQAQKDAFERVYRLIGEVANERGVPYCDARVVLEAEAARQSAANGKDQVFTNEVHMTDAGCELLARTIAERIVELGLVK